ncbi:YadA-like family protein [uncultured Cloacibacillus sp.]|uniref:YadA-like family protein n=1 Tax=uncultured Cloacibacillus sp. TaxID=889794 RepID=UPI0025F5B0A6|nr:YadA-like family protein [uncultured Cloacibacillus sp.]
MKDEEKKNESPTPSRKSVRASYIWFIGVMIFMLVFCALFLSSASAEASCTAGGGTTAGDTSSSSVSIGAGGLNGAVTNGSDCVSVGAAAAAKNNGATAVGAHSAVDVNYGVALGAYTEAHRRTADGGYYMPEAASEAEKQAVSSTARAADGKYYGVASIGNNGHTRQLVGVAAGSLDTDAANVSQLKALEGAMSRSVEAAKNENGGKIKALDDMAVKYDGKDKNSVTLTSAQEGEAVRLTNVADGKIVQYGRDAVNGGQLWTLGSSVAGALGGSFSVGAGGGVTGSFTVDGKEAASVQEAIDQTVDLAKNAKKSEWKLRVNGKETAVRDGDVIAVDEGKNISIAPDANTGVYKVGVVDNPEFASVKAGSVLIGGNGIDMGGTRMTGLADGRVYRGSSDAVTGGQLWDAYRRIDKIDERAKMIGAHAAALSALHPVPYNPYEPTTFSAGFGAYRGEYSAAVGVFHYVRENLLVNTGLALNTGGDLMARAGISVAVGRGGQRRASLVRDMTDVQRELAAMRQTIAQLKKENAQNKETIRELRKASHKK